MTGKSKFSFPKVSSIILLAFLLMAISLDGLSKEDTPSNSDSDWPQWRGSNRDGVSTLKNITTDWSDLAGQTLWRIPAGEGYSGISVARGKLLTMWDAEQSQFLVSLDAQTGEENWRFKIGDSFQNSYGNGPRSTPAIDDSLVYAISARGLLVAVEVESGALNWQHDLASEYGGRIPGIGYSSSPLLYEDKLFVEVGGEDDFAFAAFQKQTGKLLWHSQSDLPAYSSPIIANINNRPQLVFLSADGLFSLSPQDGQLRWQYSWQTRCPSTGIPLNAATPLFLAPDKIFISSGYGTVSGGILIQVKEQDGQFTAEKLWQTDEMKNLFNSSVLFEQHIYGFDGAILKPIDAASGEEKWKARGFQRGSLVLVDNYLIVLGERGKLALVEATPERFNEITSFQALDGKCWTSPTLANGKLYLRNHKEIVAFDIQARE